MTTTEATAEAAPETRPTDRDAVFDAFRRWGYLEARLDPLDRIPPLEHPDLRLEGDDAEEARRIYCGSIGVEFMHIPDPERRRWVAERMETRPPRSPNSDRILERLLAVETFEQVLQSRYLGTKRFSVEGVTALVPLLDALLEGVARHGGKQVVLAMSHRGRLAVMHSVVGVPSEALLAGFEDVDPRSVLGGGDVKYHLGATGTYETRDGGRLGIHLVSNPSHLEAVDPVALGRIRAKQQRFAGEQEERHKRVVPVLLHGDAAFAGQGILAEILNLSELPGFHVGGSVHVIVNNLIGFTTEPYQLHSSRFASDVAKRLAVPILHVNGEDPEAVVRAAEIAIEFRTEFLCDVVLDLIGYRRHGHSEVDDPTITQPLLYKALKDFPPLWQSYACKLGIPKQETDERASRVRAAMDEAQKRASGMSSKPKIATLPPYWDRFHGGPWKPEDEVETHLSAAKLAEITDALTSAPDGFHVHPKIAKLLEQRREMGHGERPLDYGMAEALAFGSLLAEGVPVRLTGQDSRRGTFAHRHAVLVDVEDGHDIYPLAALARDGAFFEVYDSMLSEAAVLGFEYGFARDYPEALTCWEAQFGDFVNGAQIIIDQFVTASEDKWGLLAGLVMLLPHGFEGQGPEHSSARMERFLTLAAEDNIQVCQPSTAAQYFHLLRRQALRSWRKPLITFTPKSMLRHKDSSSELSELTQGGFQRILPDREVESAVRILLGTGKIVHELRREREKRGDSATAIVAVEQLYPFPEKELSQELERHGEPKEIVWVQEEPANMGALFFVKPRIERLLKGRRLRSFQRSASGSPATGSARAHQMEQKTLLTLPFEIRHEGKKGGAESERGGGGG